MLIKEYRVVMPMTADEYQIGQLFAVADMSKAETGGGEGVEVLKNEPYDDENGKGQYTHKIYHLNSKVPAFLRALAPSGSLEIEEKAWNGYPLCKTVLTNRYMQENFQLVVTTIHKDNDCGDSENVHNLPPEKLQERDVVMVDIAKDQIEEDYNPQEDPRIFVSEKAARGPLGPNWANTHPVMTCYKLVEVNFKWFGLQTTVEKSLHGMQKGLNVKFNRKVFCWIDKWHGMTIEDIRKYEEETRKELELKRAGETGPNPAATAS